MVKDDENCCDRYRCTELKGKSSYKDRFSDKKFNFRKKEWLEMKIRIMKARNLIDNFDVLVEILNGI